MDKTKTPLAVAIWVEVINLFCLLLVGLFPDVSRTVAQSWMHRANLAAIWNPTITVNSVILGAVSVFIAAYIAAWLFVIIYKAIVK